LNDVKQEATENQSQIQAANVEMQSTLSAATSMSSMLGKIVALVKQGYDGTVNNM